MILIFNFTNFFENFSVIATPWFRYISGKRLEKTYPHPGSDEFLCVCHQSCFNSLNEALLSVNSMSMSVCHTMTE
jgi:hypothetical protein